MSALLLQTIDSLSVSFPKPSEEGCAVRNSTRQGSSLEGQQRTSSLNIPSLSLNHHKHFSERGDRKQVEEYAASLLARPLQLMTFEDQCEQNDDGGACFRAKSLQQMRQMLLENATECFAVLVDCRLRAYATFLARYGITLAKKCESEGAISMEQKVAALLDRGKSIMAREIQLAFVPSTNDCLEDGDDECNDGSNVALEMRMDLKLELTRPSGVKELLSAAIAAPGFASENQSGEVQITLNTRQLLEAMIHQASNVVAAVVEIANTASILSESKLSRSASFLAMPPPSKIMTDDAPYPRRGGKARWLTNHQRTLSACSDEIHPVVSPDTRAVAASCFVPSLDLEWEHEASSRDLTDLTPEACEDLVDGILGDWRNVGSFNSPDCDAESDELLLPSPSKKPRLIA